MRIDVDPGEKYSDSGFAPSSVYWAEYVQFNGNFGGYLGLQRGDGAKLALVSIWSGLDAKAGVLPVKPCNENGPCVSVGGPYDWKVGHQYRFRVELSPRTPSDAQGNWWQITLADLTTGTIDILGELKTPKSGGLSRSNGVFLEYFWGPYQCDTLRHAKATEASPRGNYGQATALSYSNGDSYGDPDVCPSTSTLYGMTPQDFGSSSKVDGNNTITLLGNNYRGIFNWGAFSTQAKAGMMYVANTSDDYPYIYRAVHDGAYWYFPAAGANNADWTSVGTGYPIINDLFFRNQRLYEWSERGASYVKIGDYFVYTNPYVGGEVEFFKLAKAGAGYYPTDRTSNAYWTYVGRYPRKNEAVPTMPVHTWNEDPNRNGRKGSLYVYPGNPTMYFIKKTDGQYWYFPTTPSDNDWWQFVGYHS